MAKYYCPYCGKDAAGEWSFCYGCGKSLPRTIPATPSTPVIEIVAHAEEQTMPGAAIPAGIPTATSANVAITTPYWSFLPHPWRRFWARVIDNFGFGLIFAITMNVHHILWGVPARGILIVMMAAAVWIPIEAAMLAKWGATPGKLLLNIKISEDNSDLPSFSSAVDRAIHVWMNGLGCGIPLASTIATILAYRHLKDEGISSWDEEGGTVVWHGRMGPVRTMLLLFVPVLSIVVFLSVVS